jgi:hypothetical protein
MIQELIETKETDSFDDLCLRLGDFLGIGKAVPLKVLLRAINDPAYANDLIVSRNMPGFLQPLFDDPQTAFYATHDVQGREQEKSNSELLSKAARAFIGWGKTGFSVVDQTTLERRENACLACPNLTAPEKALQKLAASRLDAGKIGRRTGNKVCTLCGCNVSKKIRLPGEACPDNHPAEAGKNRWGEPQPV